MADLAYPCQFASTSEDYADALLWQSSLKKEKQWIASKAGTDWLRKLLILPGIHFRTTRAGSAPENIIIVAAINELNDLFLLYYLTVLADFVIQFYPWFKFSFLLFLGIVMYNSEFETKENKI